MRIVIYLGTFKKNHDGVARATYQLVDSLLTKGHKVLVASPLITPQRRKNLILFKFPAIPLFFYPEYKFGIPIMQYFNLILRFKPDIIHIATPDLIGMMTSLFGHIRKIPQVFAHHSDIIAVFRYYGLGFLEKGILWMYRTFYNHACATFVPTRKIQANLRKHGIHRVFLWSRGIDRKQFHPNLRSESLRKSWGAENRPVILYTGRLVWYKDLDVLAEVYLFFQDQKTNKPLFVLAGDGPIRKDIEKLMPKAVFLGYVEDLKLGKTFASSDLFLFPSTTETFGQVVQEALASGIPAIVSNIGGCQEIIEKSQAGMIVAAKDSQAFLKACKKLLEDKEFYQRCQFNGLKFAKNRSWSHINEELLKKYEKIIDFWHNERKKKM
ncbi:MAG: glycosyltransferase family 4 protein [Promethearchaeota archaeon]